MYRENASEANVYVQKALVNSLEFSGVVKTRVEELYPMPIYGYTMWSLPFDDSDIINRTLEDVIQSVCGET
jgi:hypothetical protein